MSMETMIWEEKNLIEQSKKFENSGKDVLCDTTKIIKKQFVVNEWKDITKIKISGIYKIINKINGKYYIGSSVDIIGKQGRFNNHVWKLLGNRHDNAHLQYAWNKYGNDAFVFEICELVDVQHLQKREQEYLDIIPNRNLVYNISFIADRVEMTPDVKNKISLFYKGKPKTKEHALAIKKACSSDSCRMLRKNNISGKQNPNYNSMQYCFVNQILNETFTGTVTDFCVKYSIFGNRKLNVFALTRKKQKSAYGWIISME